MCENKCFSGIIRSGSKCNLYQQTQRARPFIKCWWKRKYPARLTMMCCASCLMKTPPRSPRWMILNPTHQLKPPQQHHLPCHVKELFLYWTVAVVLVLLIEMSPATNVLQLHLQGTQYIVMFVYDCIPLVVLCYIDYLH